MTYNKCVTAFAQEPLDAAIQKISPELFDQYEIFKSREMLLEWSPKNVHKATGLAKLISHLESTKAKSWPVVMRPPTFL